MILKSAIVMGKQVSYWNLVCTDSYQSAWCQIQECSGKQNTLTSYKYTGQ